jgi:formylglycine-generating enzyme required for sulfatase activity
MVVPGKPDERLVLLDFGLARLRGAAGGATDSAGGTPAYMAPEQLRDGRVDARSDVFSAALVLVALLTGWRRRTADQLVPPLDGIDDPALRRVLAKALALSPADRYQSGGELAEALGAREHSASIVTSPPFRHLAAFTEADRDRLYGRDREIATLVEHVLFRRAVVYTAPSGTGKTSLLRAGLVPRLGTLGVSCVYVSCHGREPPNLARAIWQQGATPAEAARHRIASEKKRLVVIVDQVEAAIANLAFTRALRELEQTASELEIGIVLSVREDVLASVLARLDGRSNIVRLGPLAPEGAREAIVGPLIERRITIEESLLEALLADLERAASLLAGEMRWTAAHAIYPPHLQLACSALYDKLGTGEQALGLRHYEQLGGLDEIVRDYLDRVLETELPAELVASARRVLLALIETDRTRAVRTDGELAERIGENVRLAPVLEALRQRGIIVPLRSSSGAPAWELVHDSLVPRVLAWIDRQDLARQRALEIVRHHLRGSRANRPSLLSPSELHEIKSHADAIAELDREWQKRGPIAWSPEKLVRRSRQARRQRWLAMFAAIVAALGTAGFFGVRWLIEHEERQREEWMSKADLGIFILQLRAFDWNPRALVPLHVPVPDFDWKLVEPSAEDELAPSDTPIDVSRTAAPCADPLARAYQVEARGGNAILVVSRAGCEPSIIPLERLPGYSQREHPPTLTVMVPTCAATLRGMVDIEAGPFISGGLGEPPVVAVDDVSFANLRPERTLDLAAFAIDRSEVPNAAFQLFTSASQATALSMPAYPSTETLHDAALRDFPVTGVGWSQARAYCRFLGKTLPSDAEWEKAMRGGVRIHGSPNPWPRRNVPWGSSGSVPANLVDTGGERPAGVFATRGDLSPYGVLNLAGNVQEWTRTPAGPGFYVTRGCSWGMCTSSTLANVLAMPNLRSATLTSFELGFRCVLTREQELDQPRQPPP